MVCSLLKYLPRSIGTPVQSSGRIGRVLNSLTGFDSFFSILHQRRQVTPQRLQRVVLPANLEIVLDGVLA